MGESAIVAKPVVRDSPREFCAKRALSEVRNDEMV
jgi:hypothetical protein